MASAAVDPEQPRVLVVDDSRIVRATIGKHVKGVYDVREAADGEDGWSALVADETIRVVISDLSMPRLDGFGLIERIRASSDARIRSVPIIMISGDDEEQPRKRASALGATAFITKGVGGGELLARLEALIKSPPAPAHVAGVVVTPTITPPAGVTVAATFSPPAGVSAAAAVRTTHTAGVTPTPSRFSNAMETARVAEQEATALEAARVLAAEQAAEQARVQAAAQAATQSAMQSATQSTAQSPSPSAGQTAEQARVQAAEQAVNDPLTGLLTLSALVKQGAQLFAYARRHQLALSVMRVMLDDSDALRAKVGDKVADQILVAVAKLLSSRMRKEDCVARTGPGEFAVALPAATRAGAARLAERLSQEVRQAKIVWQGQAVKISASIGVADTVSDGGESFADIYSAAAKRVDRAREQGGGLVVANDVSQEDLDAAVQPATPVTAGGLSIDQALRMLAAGRGAELEVHVPELARTVYPLVKFCDEMFEKASASRQNSVLKAAELLLLKTQPMETLKQRGFLE
jgi:diguanylate cyclase (GGDEF)-like protein